MVANIYEVESRNAIERMRKRFAEDISGDNAPLGIRTVFSDVVCRKEAGPTKLEFTALATTDAVDMASEVVVRDGCDWEQYFKANGMTLFADHCYGVSSRIGYARSLPTKCNTPRGGKGWLLTGIVDRASSLPMVQAVVAGLLDGRIGLSIGFEALEWGDPTPDEQRQYLGVERMIRRCKILEVSATYFPCNVECQTLSVSVDEAKAAELATLVTKGRLPQSVVSRLLVPREGKADPAGAKSQPTPPQRKIVVFVDA